MPQAVLVAALPAAIAGATSVTGAVVGSRAQSRATQRGLTASREAAARAEAFEREQEAANRAERDREAEEQRRQFDITQANTARQQAIEDAIMRDNLERAAYEDAIKYGKAVNLARLTGQAAPMAPPRRTAASLLNPETQAPASASSAPMLARPSVANAMVDRTPISMAQSPAMSMQAPMMGRSRRISDLARRRMEA